MRLDGFKEASLELGPNPSAKSRRFYGDTMDKLLPLPFASLRRQEVLMTAITYSQLI